VRLRAGATNAWKYMKEKRRTVMRRLFPDGEVSAWDQHTNSRLRIGKLEILDIAASPGPGTERLGPRTDVRAEDIDKLNFIAMGISKIKIEHEPLCAFRIVSKPQRMNE
jgi:hypothetical protein